MKDFPADFEGSRMMGIGGSTMGMDTLNTKSGTGGGDFVETSSIHNLTRPVTPVLTRQVILQNLIMKYTKN